MRPFRRRGSASERTSSAPTNLSELLTVPGVEEACRLGSTFGFMAIHGGDLERMTDVIAEQAAEDSGASVYLVRHPDGYPDHPTSRLYRAADSERLAAFLDHVDVVVSLHGFFRFGHARHILAGGCNRELAAHVARTVEIPGYRVVTDPQAMPAGLRGMHPDNPVNKPRGGGCQLELPPRIRSIGPFRARPHGDGLSEATEELVQGLTRAAREWPPARR